MTFRSADKENQENQELQDIFALIETKFQHLQERLKEVQTAVLYQPKSLPYQNQFVMMARVEVEYSLRVITESHFGPQKDAATLSGCDHILAILEKEEIIDIPLANDIRDFFRFTTPFIREPISSQVYIQIQYLTSDILERIYLLPTSPNES